MAKKMGYENFVELGYIRWAEIAGPEEVYHLENRLRNIWYHFLIGYITKKDWALKSYLIDNALYFKG